MASARPWWCQDPTCTPINNTPHAHDPARYDLSGFCAGCLAAPITFERHGYQHNNDMHLCFRSAVRGVVMLETDTADMENVARAALHTLAAREPERGFSLRWLTGRDDA
jgi:hypothetical protein